MADAREARKSLLRKMEQGWWWHGSLKIHSGGQEVKGQGVRTPPAFCKAVTLVDIHLLNEVNRKRGRQGMGQDLRTGEGCRVARCGEFRSVCTRGRRS